MTKETFVEKITAMVRKNIKKMEDAGCGMYNLSLYDFTFRRITYHNEIIFQTYPYEDNDFYGLTYLLLYYEVKKDDWEHQDVEIDELTEDELDYLYRKVAIALGVANEDKITTSDIKDVCYGRDDLLAVAEQICADSGLDAADGEVLCEELARTAFDYLNWINKPVEEENYRTRDDTQIFKQYEGFKSGLEGEDAEIHCEISEAEWTYIRDYLDRDDTYKMYDDEANGYIAFSFDHIDQKEDSEWGDNLVDALNDICIRNGENPNWFLGDENEEYVFVD